MQATDFPRRIAYLIILTGIAIAVVTATVPHFTAGYRLDIPVLLIMLLPFIAYGALVLSLRRTSLLISGLILLGVCLALLINERFVHYDGYREMSVFWIPLVVSAIVLPLAYWIGKRPSPA